MQGAALIILDGWGLAPPGPGNCVRLAKTPVAANLEATCPGTTLVTSGRAVGLPEGQMGNSEVGHLTLGSGASSPDLVRISTRSRTGRSSGTGPGGPRPRSSPRHGARVGQRRPRRDHASRGAGRGGAARGNPASSTRSPTARCRRLRRGRARLAAVPWRPSPAATGRWTATSAGATRRAFDACVGECEVADAARRWASYART
jgi:hypothetical protein